MVNDPEKSPLVAAATQTAGLNKFTNNCPAFVIVCEEDAYLIGGKEPNQKYAHIDIGLSVSQLCYAATQQGLSTCIMGSFDQKMLLDSLGTPSPNGCCWWLQSAMPPPTRAPQKAQTARRGDDLHWIRISSRPRWSPP